MKAHRSKRLGLIILMTLMISTAIGLTLWALRQNINLYFTPSQLVQEKTLAHPIRVGGLVKKGSVHYNSHDLRVRFVLTDLHHEVPVCYQGVLPDLFREGQGLIVEGRWKDHAVLKATRVLAKHDENYQPPAIETASNVTGSL